eukprot:symbB.v1.2.025287.t1/scaffold2445.1/size151041/15
MDENGVVWGAEIGEVIPGQILHAAGAPVIEDGHTTVALQTGGAIDVSLVQVAVLEHPDEENGEQHGNFGPEGHYEEPPPSEGLPHGAPGGMHGEPFEGEHEGFEGREEPGFEGHPEFEGHEGHREEYEGREEPAFQGHQEEFEGHQLPEEGQEVPPHFQHPPGQWEESQDEPQHDGAKFPGHGSPDEFAENAGETEHGPFEGPGEPEGEQMVHHGEEMQEQGIRQSTFTECLLESPGTMSSSSVDRMKENLAVHDWDLSATDMKELKVYPADRMRIFLPDPENAP